MTAEEIIRRARELDALWAGAADKRAHFFENNGMSELATCASCLADAYDAQARELAEVKAERDALKAKEAQAVGVIADLPTMDDPDMMCLCISDVEAILKGDQ